jgi:hypothetical protein
MSQIVVKLCEARKSFASDLIVAEFPKGLLLNVDDSDSDGFSAIG